MTVGKQDERVLLELPDGCFEGLKELASISRAHTVPITIGSEEEKPYFYFSRCVFEPEENWTALVFDRLLDANGQLIRLCGELEKRGYRRIDCFDGKKVGLEYVKQHGKKEEPLKWAWAERTHSGISLTYEELRLAPCFLWVRMPMYKTVLACADKLPENVRSFIQHNTKTCDGCRYCVQTDKTNTRPLAAVHINGEDLCPLYPGFTMNWRALSLELSDHILALLDALNGLPELA